MSPRTAYDQVVKEIEHAGSKWGRTCARSSMTREDLKWWATKYRPFYGYIRRVGGIEQCFVKDFDPHDVHPLAKTLFAPAWEAHGASWVFPGVNNSGKVPDFRFAAFERGVIQQIQKEWRKVGRKKVQRKKDSGIFCMASCLDQT